MKKLLFILLAVLIGKIAQAQNAPINPYIELRILDASQTQCVLNYCPPFSYYKQAISPEVTLSSWVHANPKVITRFTYNSCLGRSDDSIYKAGLYRKSMGYYNAPRTVIIEQYVFSFQCRYHRTF